MTVIGIHPEDLFDKLLDGEISPPERERLRLHLDACEVCRFEYAARLDFQAEALELSALGAPPSLPLRPMLGPESQLLAPPAVGPVRRRRKGFLVWGLAAAALITASGAVASSLAGHTAWHSVSALFSQTAAPAEVSLKRAKAPVAAAVAPGSAAASVDSPAPVAATPVAAPPVAAALMPHAAPKHVHEAARPKGVEKTVLVAAAPALPAVRNSTDSAAVAKEPAAKEPTSAAKLFGEANQARRSGDLGRASGLYHLLQDQFAGSPEADLSRVTLALLLLDSGDAHGALSGFERYLAGSSRGLEAEALVGRARALGRLGRRDLEASAWLEVQRKYPRSIYGRQASERLAALGQP